MSIASFAYPTGPAPWRGSTSARRPDFGFERLAMLLLPIAEAVSTSLGDVPLFTGIKITVIAGLFGLAALTTRRPPGMRRGTLRGLLLILGLYTAISRLVYLGASEAGPIAFIGVLLTFPALLWLLTATPSHAAFRGMMRWFVVGAAVGGVISTGLSLQVLTEAGVRGWARVSTEVSANRNSVAPIYVIALSAIMFLPLELRRTWKLACGGIILVALLLLFSRSGYVALAIPLLLALRAGAAARLATIPLLAIAALALVVPGSPIADRIDYTFEGHGANTLDDSAETRIEIWQAAIRDFEDNPFFGSGSGKSPLPFYDVRRSDILYDHNYFLTQLSQLGLIGFAITLAMFGCFLGYAVQQPGTEKYFALSFVLTVMVSSLTGEPLYGLVAYLLYVVAIQVSRQVELGTG